MTIGTIAALFAATAVSAPVLVATAPQAKGDGGHCHGPMGKFGRQLDLTQNQKDQAKLLAQEAKAAREAILADKSLDQEARSAKLKQLRERTKLQMDSVLTAEQRAKVAAARAAWEQKKSERKAAMAKELGLTAEQQAKLDALKAGMRAEMESLRGSFDREQMKQRMEAFRNQMDSILTPEQKAKMESFRGKRKGWSGKQGGFARPGSRKGGSSAIQA